jgi:hypothetical protein
MHSVWFVLRHAEATNKQRLCAFLFGDEFTALHHALTLHAPIAGHIHDRLIHGLRSFLGGVWGADQDELA